MGLSQADSDAVVDGVIKAGSLLIDAITGVVSAAAQGNAAALAALDPAHAAALAAYLDAVNQVAAARAQTDAAIAALRKTQAAASASPVVEATLPLEPTK